MDTLRAPFSWFGGKSRASALIWDRLGDVDIYAEPFAGSLAVLLRRQALRGHELVNDLDCYLVNFWRAVQWDPVDTAKHADWPLNEADLHARHAWLIKRAEFRERMLSDPEFFDPRIAGWWAWGLAAWLGGEWCSIRWNETRAGRPDRRIPKSRNGMHSVGAPPLTEWFEWLSQRLRRVEVACGSWERILTPAKISGRGIAGVLLDPPYSGEDRDSNLYAVETDVAADVGLWAIEHGDDPAMRIALCGYEGHYQMPASWECVPWKASGGYGNAADGQGRENATRERIWFSPHCLQPGLFSGSR